MNFKPLNQLPVIPPDFTPEDTEEQRGNFGGHTEISW